MRPYKIVIADDHPVFRKGLSEIIDHTPNWQVIAEAESGVTALQYYEDYRPDIIVLDISMGELSGLDVAERILKAHKAARCVIMTMYKEIAYCQRALSLGVQGYLLKDDASGDIIACLESVIQGKRFVSEALGGLDNCCPIASDVVNPESILTDRELSMLEAIADLKTNKQIAREFDISARTVQNHRQNMSQKLHLTGRQALLQFAVKWAESKRL